MQWRRLLAALLFLTVFGVALMLQAPSALVQRVLGSGTLPVLALAASHSVASNEEVPVLKAAAAETHLAWRYEHFSLAQFGPVYRVGLTGEGFTGKGRLAVTPFNRIVLMDARLAILLPEISKDLWQAMFRPLGRAFVSIDHFEAALQPLRVDGLGRVNTNGFSDGMIDEWPTPGRRGWNSPRLSTNASPHSCRSSEAT